MAAPAHQHVRQAVAGNAAHGSRKLLDLAFARAFRGLVYAQIWEDPVVDMAALQIRPDSRVVTIASGGCNVLSYLVADPAQVIAVDLNAAHIALNKLKIAAARHLPDYDHFQRFFAEADSKANIAAWKQYVRDHLDETTRRYWEGRDLIGRQRVRGFARGFYKRGLLGTFITAAHVVARLYRIDPREILEAGSIEEQRHIFETRLAPIFDRRFVRWLTDQPASLFGLGIPPAQYEALAGDAKMAVVLRRRLEKLACDFRLDENYFAAQAFGRGYGKGAQRSLPPYLEEANYPAIRERMGRIEVRHANLVHLLAAEPDGSLDRYVLLDAQDWMDADQLTALWQEITRTARPGARVLFRTAAEPTLLPGMVRQDLLDRWDYRAGESLDFTRADRSSIYGGVHLYVLRD